MVSASFQINDKLEKVWFFQKTFLLTDFNLKVVLEIFFLTFNNTNILFVEQKLRFYIAIKALPITKQMKIMDEKKFAKAALDKYIEIFLVFVTFLLTIIIHLAKKAQIALLVIKKMQIQSKYLGFLNIFLEKKALILLEANNFN